MVKTKLLLAVACFLALVTMSQAQLDHFSPVSGNENNAMTIGIAADANLTVDGVSLENGDEIAVFTKDGDCVGAVEWTGSQAVLTAYGKEQSTPGYLSGETLIYRLWDQSADAEYNNISTVHEDYDGNTIDGKFYTVEPPIIYLTTFTASSTPLAPTLVGPEGVDVDIAGNIEWESVLNATSYDVQLDDNSDFSSPIVDETGVTGTTQAYTGLEYNTTYYVQVRANSPGGNSAWTQGDFLTTNPDQKLVEVTLGLVSLYNNGDHIEVAVSVELRTGEDLFNSTLVSRKAGLVNSDGIVTVDFADVANGDYYLITRATGFMPLAATSQISLSTTTTSYDFTTSSSQSVASDQTVVEQNGVWLAVPGDINQDISVSPIDFTLVRQYLPKTVFFQIPEID